MNYVSKGYMGGRYAIKLLNGAFVKKKKIHRKQCQPAHYGKKVIEILLRLWQETDGSFRKRLTIIKDLWLSHYEKVDGVLKEEVKEQLKSISAAQIDRMTTHI